MNNLEEWSLKEICDFFDSGVTRFKCKDFPKSRGNTYKNGKILPLFNRKEVFHWIYNTQNLDENLRKKYIEKIEGTNFD